MKKNDAVKHRDGEEVEMSMELVTETMDGMPEIGSALQGARLAVDEARAATVAAEAALRDRQADEAASLEAYEQVAQRARDTYATERRQIEEKVRAAQSELETLASTFGTLGLDAPSDDVSVTTPVPEPAVGENDRYRYGAETETETETQTEAPTPEDTGTSYEDEWYQRMRNQSLSANGTTSE